MLEFFVNKIEEENNVTHGDVAENSLVLENFATIYGIGKANGLMALAEKNKANFYLIERFGNYVGFIQYKTELGFLMRLSDFGDNIDNVLDEYLELEAKNWKIEERVKYVRIAKEIMDNKPEVSKLTIVNPI